VSIHCGTFVEPASTHDPHPVVRGSASAVVAAAYNQSGADYIAYARQCRAFGLTLSSLRDKDKMWRETLLGRYRAG
jgi:hypothetical protein